MTIPPPLHNTHMHTHCISVHDIVLFIMSRRDEPKETDRLTEITELSNQVKKVQFLFEVPIHSSMHIRYKDTDGAKLPATGAKGGEYWDINMTTPPYTHT